jgi:tetratricopeptide (TPR) repeat protein
MLNRIRRRTFSALVGSMMLVIMFLTSLWLPIAVQGKTTATPTTSVAAIQPATLEQQLADAQTALQRAKTQGDRQLEQASLESIARILIATERYQATIATGQALLTLSQTTKNERDRAKALTYLGIAEKNLGHYADAIGHYQDAARIFHRLNDRQAFGITLLNLGNLRAVIGADDRAEKLYRESLNIALEFNDEATQASLLTNLGGLYVATGEFDKATKYLQDALKLHQSRRNILGQTQALTTFGALQHFRGQLAQAIAYYQQALSLARQTKNQQSEIDLLSSLALAQEEQQKFPAAIALHTQAVNLARILQLPETLANALNNQSNTYYVAKQYPEALAAVNQSIQLLEGLRPGLDDRYNVSIFDTQIKSYQTLEQILVAANQPEAALEASEKRRARAFAELLAKRDGKASIAPIDLNEIRRMAKVQKATIVEYSLVPDIDFRFLGKQKAPSERLLIWVVQPTGQISLRQVDLKRDRQTQGTINQMVAAARCLHPKPICPSVGELAKTRGIKIGKVKPTVVVTPTQSADINNPLAYPGLPELYQILIAPIADLLPKNPNDRVVIIPTESLFLVPFPALVDAKGNYLVKQHTLLSAPSIQVLGLTNRGASAQNWKNPEELVVLGNPSPMPESLDALPAAEREAIAVAKMLKTQALIGGAATRANLMARLGRAKLIHLATHGLLEYGQESGLDSMGAIALTQTTDDPGLLTATAIAALKTQADLVVLSACDTGRGTITGDGVLGLARSWMAAGASSVVVSLWAVNDQSTSELMQAFYQGLAGQPDRAVALRQAMLATMEQYPSPYDWAAFSLMGQSGG